MIDECQCEKSGIAAAIEGMDGLVGRRNRERREYYRTMWKTRCDGLWLNRAKSIVMENGPGRTVIATFDVSPSDTSVVPEVTTIQIAFSSPFMTIEEAAMCLDELLNLLARGWNEERAACGCS